MYVADHFALTTEQAMALISPVAGGDLVSIGESGLEATFIPMLFDPADGEHGTLIGHLSRVNPQWRSGGEAMFIVNGPQDFVDSDWLSRPDAPSVPTWNYITVHAHGELIAHPDPAWSLEAVRRISAGRQNTSVEELPADAVEKLNRSIIGVELRITKLIGKAKMNQNKSPEIVQQVIDGFEATGNTAAASWMRENALPRALARAELVNDIRQRSGTAS
jgi:transcriptional regulator